MGRRLEKYYLLCNTVFLSLFVMKFVRYIYIRQHTLQVGTKKACKLYRKFPIHIGNLHSKLEQNTPTKYAGNFRYWFI